jgi:sucrose phosphorylase
MKFRNNYKVFNGQMTIAETEFPNMLEIKWSLGEKYAILKADLTGHDFEILYFEEGKEKKLDL